MTRPPTPDLTADEQAVVDRFGIFAEEERVERVALAIASEAFNRYICNFADEHPHSGAHFRRLAVAAIEALGGTS